MLARISLIILLLLSFGFTQELKLYRLNDMIGDTIDIQEKEYYYLFPGIDSFESAQIYIKPDSSYLIQINRRYDDTLHSSTIPLTNYDIKRINNYFINIDTIKELIIRDEAVKATYNRFWYDIESRQFQKPKSELKSREGRILGSMTGMTLGSAIGGCVGSQVGIEYIGTRYEPCFPARIAIPMYKVNYPIFCGINALTIGAGTYIGYKLGEQKDRKYSPVIMEIKEGKGWQISLGIISGLIGTAVGVSLFGISVMSLFGREGNSFREVEGEGAVVVPALLMGVGIITDIAYLGHKLGQLIDHNRAVKKAKRNIKPTNNK